MTEDWRFHHKLIWEIPTVAVAIMAGILAVAYTQLFSWPRIALLSVGAALLFGLTIATVKHRFGADYRSQYLEECESELNIPVLPLSTKKALKKMEEDGKELTDDRFYRFIVKRDVSAEIFLIYLTFSAAILLILLGIYESGTTIVEYYSQLAD